MPAWIHDRAMSMKKDMEKTYGKDKAEQVAFAVATQQAHRLGKSPKTFKSKVTGKKERFGTPEGRREAKAKFDKPRKEYKKTAAEGSMETALETNEPSVAGEMPHPDGCTTDHVTNDITPQASGADAQKQLAPYLKNKGELSMRREVEVKNVGSENPTTPTIKTAMYGAFFDEFTKIAASPQKRIVGKELKRRAAHLMESTGHKLPRGEAAESMKAVVQSARKKLPWHTRAVQALKREEHPAVVRAVRKHTGRV